MYMLRDAQLTVLCEGFHRAWMLDSTAIACGAVERRFVPGKNDQVFDFRSANKEVASTTQQRNGGHMLGHSKMRIKHEACIAMQQQMRTRINS